MHVPAISLAAFLTLASTLTSALPFAAPEPQQHPLKLTPHPHESYKGSVQEAVPLVPGHAVAAPKKRSRARKMTYAALGGVGGIIGGKMAYNAWQNHKANEAWKKAGGDDMPTAVGDGSQEGFTAGRSDGAPPA